MKKNKVKIIGAIAIVLVLTLGIALSYAFFSTSDKQTQANTFRSGCLNITIESESDAITLSNAYPISDVEGLSGKDYTFTIKNICNKDTNYQINLESLNETSNTLDSNYLKVALSSDTMDNLISKLGDNPTTDPMITGAYESHNLYNGRIEANGAKEFTLREWIDYDVTKEQGMNKTVTNKINVIARPDLNVNELPEIKTTYKDYEINTNLTRVEIPDAEVNTIVSTTNDTTYPFSYDEETKKYTSTNKVDGTTSSITFKVEKEGDAKICYEVSSEVDYDKAIFYVGSKQVEIASGEKSNCIILQNVGPDKDIKVEYVRGDSPGFGNDEVTFSIELLPIDKLPIKYCISDKNKCEPNVDGNIINNKLDLDLKARSQIVCTKVNNSKTSCSDVINVELVTVSDILAKYTKDNSRSGEITAGFKESTPTTVFSKEDDDGTSYVFAGVNPNNWVKIGSMYFRIIRFNGDGTMRLIYSGASSPETSGDGTQIGTSKFNSSGNGNAYVGFMYGSTGASTYNETHTNTNSSTIKGVLETWYTNNLVSYENVIDINAGFCGDRKLAEVVKDGYNRPPEVGYGNNLTTYITTDRYYNSYWDALQSYTPSLKCSRSLDLYTKVGATKGNKALTNPIGLITADEYMLVGGSNEMYNQNKTFWLHTGKEYLTISPYSGGFDALVFSASSNGCLSSSFVADERGVRPVINLKSSTTFETGNYDGSAEKPWTVKI